MLEQFFVTDVDPSKLVTGTYDPWLVLLSVFLASMASFFALRLAAAARHIVISKYRRIALFSGAFIMAGGIWSMHFVGMLAFAMPHSMDYDPMITALSLLPAIVASYIVLKSLIDETDSCRLTLRNGLIVGAGIGAMHYLGMEAMRMDMALRYDPYWFALSIVVAVVLAFIALSARRLLRKRFPALRSLHVKLISAVIMGAAISGMHYTGMEAARFIEQLECITPVAGMHAGVQDNQQLALAVAIFTLLISTLALNVSSQLRYRQLLSEKTSGEARLQAILDTATDGVITINAKGEIQGINAAVSQIFGWQENEVLGRNVSMLMPSHHQQQHDGYLKRYLETGKASVIGSPREVYARHRNGDLIPVRLGVGRVNLDDGETLFVGFIADISQRKAMEEKLRESEERLSSLMQNIPGASFRRLLDHGWTPIYLSDGVAELCGYSADVLLSGEVSFFDCLLEEDRPQLCDNIRNSLDERETYEIEYRVTHKDGHTVWVLENGMIVRDENGNVVWSDGVMVDISSRKQMESELLEAKLRAEDAAESKASFLANMSHEIRTPMNAIIGFTDILLDSDISGENRRHLQTICQSSRSLLHLLNDILDSAKLEKNKLEIEPIPFKLAACVDTVISTLWLGAKSKRVELDLVMSANLPEVVEGAEDRIRQVLMNLVGNGIKFTEHGSVTLAVDPMTDKPDWIRFSVTDTGIGIEPERLNAIFEPFTQADASMSRRFGGTGLGTSISKQLVELMGGQISATSQPGRGSCFVIELPLPASELTVATPSSQVVALPHLRVLVCDDIEQNINLLRILLERQGHTVFTAQDGLEAVRQYQTVHPDVVLMDIQMPNLDGLGASREIRHWEAEQNLPQVPIVALTASVLIEDRLQARDAGMAGFANKPVDFAQLTQEMARVLNIKPQTSNSNPAVEREQTTDSDYQVVHFAKAMKLWGDERLYAVELQAWLDKQGEVASTLAALADDGAWNQLAERAHALKGLAGNLALMPLFHAFTQLEKSADAHLPAHVNQALADIERYWAELKRDSARLNDHSQENAPFTADAEIDTQALIVHLNDWLHATQSGELRDDLAALLLQLSPATIKKQIVEAHHAIDEFDFKAAAQAMQQALNALQ
ncbi:PAS domain S-box protein [Vibrio fluvialis]